MEADNWNAALTAEQAAGDVTQASVQIVIEFAILIVFIIMSESQKMSGRRTDMMRFEMNSSSASQSSSPPTTCGVFAGFTFCTYLHAQHRLRQGYLCTRVQTIELLFQGACRLRQVSTHTPPMDGCGSQQVAARAGGCAGTLHFGESGSNDETVSCAPLDVAQQVVLVQKLRELRHSVKTVAHVDQRPRVRQLRIH